MFYVNDEPEGKFLYTETIKLYCIATTLASYLETGFLVELFCAFYLYIIE